MFLTKGWNCLNCLHQNWNWNWSPASSSTKVDERLDSPDLRHYDGGPNGCDPNGRLSDQILR